MKIILFLSLFLFAGMAQAFEIIGIDSVNVTAAYTEPVTNEDGSTLTDLSHVIVFYDVGEGPQVGIQEPASSPTGGTFQTVVFPVPIGAGQEADVTFYAQAFDITGNNSTNSNEVVLRIDRLAPAAPQ